MLPKNSKHYIVPTAEELGKDTQLVADAVSFYYSTVRKALVDLKHMNIQVENIGQFKVKRGEVPKLINKYEKHLIVITKDTFSQMQLRKETELKLEKAKILNQLIEDERNRRKAFYKKKKDGFEKDMGEQE